jgi:hypothetical protein
VRWVAGVDVGNATTEIVIADVSTSPPTPVAWDRTPTRGRKGSATAIHAAVDLLHRMERDAGVRADVVAVAPQRPVDTATTVLAEPAPHTGRLLLLGAGRATPAGRGVGVGIPVDVGATPDPGLGPVVLVASDPLGYRATSERVRAWVAAGCDVVGVLLAGDEAVLVSRRVGIDVPVLDQVDPAVALAARVVALEVGEPGRPARRLTDPVHLAAVLGLGQHEHPHAEALARSVRGLGDVAVAVLDSEPARGAAAPEGWFDDAEGRRHDIVRTLAAQDHRLLSSARSVGVPDATGAVVPRPVDDLWAVDLATLTRDAVLRANAVQPHAVALATLAEVAGDEIHEQVRAMAAATGRPVVAVAAESDAARAGALTTPGASPHATVVDIGGGTVDVVSPDGTARVLAGAGDLVTAATSTLLGIARGQAEWVKRGPCARVEGPHVLLDEDGTRRFLDTPAASGSVGWLVVPGPAGPLPFDRRLAPPEWRTLRLRLKSAVLGDNVARGGVGPVGGDVIVVGGPAGDDEVLDCVARVLPGSVPGRGDVAGALGHRWAVAYGLVVLAAAGAT